MGQINGTTGYEEARGPGIDCGIYAANRSLEREDFVMTRSDGYIGVPHWRPDNPRGTKEPLPYVHIPGRIPFDPAGRQRRQKAFPNRFRLGLLPEDCYQKTIKKEKAIMDTLCFSKNQSSWTLQKRSIPSSVIRDTPIQKPFNALEILRRPEISLKSLDIFASLPFELSEEEAEASRLRSNSEGYITEEKIAVDGF